MKSIGLTILCLLPFLPSCVSSPSSEQETTFADYFFTTLYNKFGFSNSSMANTASFYQTPEGFICCFIQSGSQFENDKFIIDVTKIANFIVDDTLLFVVFVKTAHVEKMDDGNDKIAYSLANIAEIELIPVCDTKKKEELQTRLDKIDEKEILVTVKHSPQAYSWVLSYAPLFKLEKIKSPFRDAIKSYIDSNAEIKKLLEAGNGDDALVEFYSFSIGNNHKAFLIRKTLSNHTSVHIWGIGNITDGKVQLGYKIDDISKAPFHCAPW